MRFVIFVLLILINVNLSAQTEYQKFLNRLNIFNSEDQKAEIVDSFMNFARSKGIPFIEGDTATFLYRGKTIIVNGKSYNIFGVNLTGDVNLGGELTLQLKKIPGTDLFALRYYLEQEARLDYNYVINNVEMITDPENFKTLPWGRIGEVSEIAMPGFIQPKEIIFTSNIPHGTRVSSVLSYTANSVKTDHNVVVYLPPGYNENPNEHYPVAYFNDGSFYISDGFAINILDNLINEKKIKPIIGVFVDYSQGNRSKEYAIEPQRYVDFFNTTLVPYIDSNYRTIQDGDNRAVIGLSFGGNISTLIVNSIKDMYKNCGLHSGAIWPHNFEAQNKIIQNDWGIKYYLTWGTYEPGLMELGVTVRDSLEAKGYTNFRWGQYPQGHSMGFWRGVTDNFLEYFFPGENATSVNNENNYTIDDDFSLNQNYPNPFNPETKISYSLKEAGYVVLKIYDVLGREIQTLINTYKSPGNYNEVFNASKLPSGNYFYSLQFGGKFVTKKMSLIK